MTERTVVDWISEEEAQLHPGSCGGMGGWFGWDSRSDRWDDYLLGTDPADHVYLEAIKADVLASGRFICGNEHQDSDEGKPLFDDGTIGNFSMRAWGDLMAAIATERDGEDHNYMEFYYG